MQFSNSLRLGKVGSLLDSDVRAFATASGATDLGGLDDLVKYVKAQGLWSDFRIYPMKSAQNAGSGLTVHGLGGLTANNMTLVNSPTWGASGIVFDGINQYGSIADFLAAETLMVFNRLQQTTAPPTGITRLYGQGDGVLGTLSIALSYAGNATGDPFRLLRSSDGSVVSPNFEIYDTTNESHTTSSQTLVNQWVNGGGRVMWQNKTSLSLTLQSGVPQTVRFNSSAPFIYSGVFDNGVLLQPNAQTGNALALVTGTVTTTQRETITDLINAL